MLGRREPSHYGDSPLAELNDTLAQQAKRLNVQLDCFQSNHEGELIDRIQTARDAFDALILNPGGYTHSSIALRDAVLASELPMVEVHLSNIYQREPFRRFSYFSDIAKGTITGLGTAGYEMALNWLCAHSDIKRQTDGNT